MLETKEQARQVHTILVKARDEAYRAMTDSFDRDKFYADQKSGISTAPREKYYSADTSEAYRIALSAEREVFEEAKQKFGNNRAHPDCDYCLQVSVFGGPGHETSPRCRSGRSPHCTCDTCF